MTHNGFLTTVNYSGWLSMNGLVPCRVASYRGRSVILLYRLNQPYGIALEDTDRLQGHGYDIITDISGLPTPQYEIITENNTMSRLLNAGDYHDIAIEVARRFDNIFKR